MRKTIEELGFNLKETTLVDETNQKSPNLKTKKIGRFHLDEEPREEEESEKEGTFRHVPVVYKHCIGGPDVLVLMYNDYKLSIIIEAVVIFFSRK